MIATALIATALPNIAYAIVSCDAQPTHEIGQVPGSAAGDRMTQILGGFGAVDQYGGNGNDPLIGGSGTDLLNQERGRGVEIQGGPNSSGTRYAG